MNRSIAIVLVEPENPSNIGAVARAMKNMGLDKLFLVKPPLLWQENAMRMAVGAFDVLKRAHEFSSLEEALKDIHFVVGTTRRNRSKARNFLPYDRAIKKTLRVSAKQPCAILFGKESKGLDNSSLAHCDWLTTIPVHPAYPSINLAQAVILVAFSLFHQNPHIEKVRESVHSDSLYYVPKKEIKEMLNQFKSALKVLDYEREGGDVMGRILVTLSGLLKRSGLIPSEVQMLKGLSRRIREGKRVQNS